MWQIREPNSGGGWRDVTCNFYWDMGRLYVCWPNQSRPTSYSSVNVRWRTVNALPNRPRRLRASFAEAA